MPAFVVSARIALLDGLLADVGAAVTESLCGSTDHEPPCRWPHNNAWSRDGGFRTIYVAPDAEEAEVRALIVRALSGSARWRLLEHGERALAEDEQDLARRLSS